MTRLETRTKESNMYASIWVIKPICEMKVTMVPGYLLSAASADRDATVLKV